MYVLDHLYVNVLVFPCTSLCVCACVCLPPCTCAFVSACGRNADSCNYLFSMTGKRINGNIVYMHSLPDNFQEKYAYSVNR